MLVDHFKIMWTGSGGKLTHPSSCHFLCLQVFSSSTRARTTRPLGHVRSPNPEHNPKETQTQEQAGFRGATGQPRALGAAPQPGGSWHLGDAGSRPHSAGSSPAPRGRFQQSFGVLPTAGTPPHNLAAGRCGSPNPTRTRTGGQAAP